VKFALIGNSTFTIQCAKALLDAKADISCMISMPEATRPNNSANINSFSHSNDLSYKEIEDINSDESIAFLLALRSDFILCEWPKILGKKVLETPKYHCIGTHPTELPHNRGRHPLHWSICLGISETKLSFFKMGESVDTGDIVLQIPFSINSDETICDVGKKLNNLAYEGTKNLYDILLANPLCYGEKQNQNSANYWRKRTPHDVTLDLRMPSDLIIRLVRSFTLPYPCANLIFDRTVIKIENAKVAPTDLSDEELQRLEPGKIISVNQKTIRVKSDDQILDLTCLDRMPDKLRSAGYIHPPTYYISKNELPLN